MKKILLLFITCLCLVGCSESITKVYPEIQNNFIESDFKLLDELSEERTLSYKELCIKFLNLKLNDEAKTVFTNLYDQNEDISIKRTDESMLIEFKYNINNTKLPCEISVENDDYKLIYASIDFKSAPNTTLGYLSDVIDLIEEADVGFNIYSSMKRELYIDNNIYVTGPKFYYLPFDNNKQFVFYRNLFYIPKEYLSFSDYTDNKLKENQNKLDELKDNLGY